ncbi:MAG: tetratricopeptide repeat protein [Deltaproteobacteria bacterium]|nr:tetratricopeptide repeat protein [Deltaproteobacteria bacterium]
MSLKFRGASPQSKLLMGVFLVLLVLTACSKGKEEAPTKGLKDFNPDLAQPDQRIEMLKAKLFDDPDNYGLLATLGDAYFESGQYAQAIEIYKKAVIVNPKSADCYNDMALAYFYTGNTDTALESSNNGIKADPLYKNTWLTKGFILMSVGKFDEAVEPLTKAKELDFGGAIGQEAENFLNQIKLQKGKS